eukprot:GHVS01044014.1.p1 GENE.GHVS01044014.1~~GHVS01044014.1.p1  ORF type:complete len:232 (+),score=45.21 GHVS01044014.1:143-838(+)
MPLTLIQTMMRTCSAVGRKAPLFSRSTLFSRCCLVHSETNPPPAPSSHRHVYLVTRSCLTTMASSTLLAHLPKRSFSTSSGQNETVFFTKSHEYVAVENAPTDGTPPDFSNTSLLLRMGVTEYAVKQLGDVVYVELPDVGRKAAKGESLITVESVKAVGEVYSPLDGTVVEVNSALADDPAAVTKDPEGEGWLIKMRPVAAEVPEPTPKTGGLGLMNRPEYTAKCLEEEHE